MATKTTNDATPATAAAKQVVVATAADEGYALPLAVTVRSMTDALGPDSHLRLFLLDAGITAATRERLIKSWDLSRTTIEWIKVDLGQFAHLPVSHHVTSTSYVRLLLGELLPADVEKVIYLDSDMVVHRDLAELYAEPLGDELALAVQETGAPWIDADLAPEASGFKSSRLAAARPVPNYQELGLRPEARYFNGGMLVFNARRWREEKLGEQFLNCLQDNMEHVLWWDQYALNVVLADNWRPIDPRWNQTAWLFTYRNWRESPYTRAEYLQRRNKPWIVHYCSPTKPWNYFCEHPFSNDFYRAMARTDWRDWRPTPPANLWAKGWKFYRRKVRDAVKVAADAAIERLRPAA